MATVNLGAIKFNWKGAYNNSTAYAVDDVVSSGGSSYICILASQGNAVSNGTYWNLMAEAGTDGTNVATTLTTQGDILYRDGSGIARLGYGTAGQLLTTGGSGANPSWTTVDSGGVIQTKYYDTGNSFTYSSTNWGNLGGLSVTITPTSTANKLLLFCQFGSAQGSASGNNTTGLKFYNDTASADVAVGNVNANRPRATSRVIGAGYANSNHAQPVTMLGFADIANTNATTFKVQAKNEGGTSYYGRAENYVNNGDIYNLTARTTFMIQEIKQ